MQLDECLQPAGVGGGHAARDGAVAALGGALQARFRERARRARFVRHRARRRRPRAACSKARANWSPWISRATPSAGWRSASRRRSCSRSWKKRRRRCRPNRPRYLMGVGTPHDLLEAVARGIDMFDCVLPTRNGRHGMAFTRFGAINLGNARHADDAAPARRRERASGGTRPIRAPICTTSPRPTRCWARCCSRPSISLIIRS